MATLTRDELLEIIEDAARSGAIKLDLRKKGIRELPEEIGQLFNLWTLELEDNQLSELPKAIGQLGNLRTLNLRKNKLTALPKEIGQLGNLQTLDLFTNQLSSVPAEIVQLTELQELILSANQLSSLPAQIVQLTKLRTLLLASNQLSSLPAEIAQLTELQELSLASNQLSSVPAEIVQLTKLQKLYLRDNQLSSVPAEIVQLTKLLMLSLDTNQLSSLPAEIAQLTKLQTLDLQPNPLNPALQSAYEAGLDELMAYLRSLEDAQPLYEAKLILVGEGAVGKTTLLNALTGREKPREGEPTTHGVEIAQLTLPHPTEEVEITFNAWDFGGQEVYRVTHQFFFSPHAIYLLLWEPRRGVDQCQVENWLKLIRLRVGNDARIIIVSTHCRSGGRIARIDKPVFRRDYGEIIVDFHEVDSMENDSETGEKVGIARLKEMITNEAVDLKHMGMSFNQNWRAARDQLLDLGKVRPRVDFGEFAAVCVKHEMDLIDTRTLATLMHDLGYIVYYADDEHLCDDVVLQPGWLTKAIGYVLEDRTTQEMAGILPDSRLDDVWLHHSLEGEPTFEPGLYPFFLRLMEKFDVSYRLETGDASLVAQHVPQETPPLPWSPEQDPDEDQHRIAMVCVMEEAPAGLVPWMTVRTHDFAHEIGNHAGMPCHAHWQKGMFLRHNRHGDAHLELRGREFHINVQEPFYPVYFMNVLQDTLEELITDNWPGLADRYTFSVPCRGQVNGRRCDGRFPIVALRRFLAAGTKEVPCMTCVTQQDVELLLHGFEKVDRLAIIEEKMALGFENLEGLVADYAMAVMRSLANEAKNGPRLFEIKPVDGRWQLLDKQYRLHLWCEAPDCQHPVIADGKGIYTFKATRDWVKKVAPYANFVAGVLKTLLPMAVPAANMYFGADVVTEAGWRDSLNLMKAGASTLLSETLVSDTARLREGVEEHKDRDGLLSEAERSGLLALHAFLREHDPIHAQLGLRRIPTYTGDFLWLCDQHYQASQPKIPDKIDLGD